MKLVDDGHTIEVQGGDDVNLLDGGSNVVVGSEEPQVIEVDRSQDEVVLADDGVAMTVIEQQEAIEAWFGPVGPRGPRGVPGAAGSAVITRTAGEAMGALRVAVATTDDTVMLADINDLSHFGRVVGVTLQAVALGDPVEIQRMDLIENTGLNFSSGDWLYIGAGGVLSATPLVGEWWQIIGYAVAQQAIDVSLREPIMMED